MDDGKWRARLFEALQGDFASTDAVFSAPSTQLLVFISSTFTDTHEERNLLVHEVLVALREEARLHGIEVVLLDLRSGIPDENTLDHLTWLGCQRELQRCFSQSAGMFFLSLQGNKYGHMPLPKYIDQEALDVRLGERTAPEHAADVALVMEWYQLDTNALRPRYVLKNLEADWAKGETSMERQFWDKEKGVLVRLRKLLEGVAFDPAFEHGIIGRSVTEYEAKLAMKLCEDAESTLQRKGMRWLRRELVGMTDLIAQDPKGELFDARDTATASKLDKFKASLESALRLDQAMEDELMVRFEVSVDAFNKKTDAYRQYLADFQSSASSMLRAALGDIVSARDAWNAEATASGLGGDALREMLHHVAWAREKCDGFVAREGLMKESLAAVKVPRRATTPDGTFAGVTLAIVGRSGTGKTALMAKLAAEVRAADPDRPVIMRFCGTSKDSADGLALVRSLCGQIQLAVDAEPQAVPDAYEEAVKQLHVLLKENAVALFIDSLDQLSDSYLARSKISFLKGVEPHPDTRIVVSALPDDKQVLTGGQPKGNGTFHFYGCDTTLAMHHVPCVTVPDFSAATATKDLMSILSALLDRQQRALTLGQWNTVMAAVKEEPTALYLNLAMYVARQWRSYDDGPERLQLRSGVTAVTEQIFEGLERDYGALVTRAALGFITWSVRGVSDVEMEDLLSLHDEVLQKVLQYCPGVKRLPSHVWLRLRGALQGLVVEQSGGCLKWYHRQLWEAAQRRYGANKEEKRMLHTLMGMYFGDLVDADVLQEKQIHRQPLTYRGVGEQLDAVMPVGRRVVVGGSIWTAPVSLVNERRAVEAGVHLLAAGLVRETIDELCNLETVCLRFKAGVGMEIVRWLIELQGSMVFRYLASVTADDRRRVEHYRRWLLRDASTMQNNPKVVLGTAAAQPKSSVVRRAAEATIVEIAVSIPVPVAHDGVSPSSCYIGSRILGGLDNFDALLSRLEGHTEPVYSVSWSPDGARLVSGSGDKTVRVWDAATGAKLATMEGHAEGVKAVSWSRDGTRLASGSDDHTVRVWDVAMGSVLSTLEGHTREVLSVRWSPDGTRLASGSCDKTVRVWDVASGAELVALEGHTKDVYSVSWSRDGTRIVSGSGDKSVRIWDVAAASMVAKLEGHADQVYSVTWSADGKRLASGSWDKTVRVWDVATSSLVMTLKGHRAEVRSVSWSKDSTRLASGSADGSVRVWDVATGAVLATRTGHTKQVYSVRWSMDGTRLASVGWDKTVRVWDVADGAVVATLEGHTDGIRTIKWSPDGTRLASGSWDKTVRVWDAAEGAVVATLKGHNGGVYSVSWSPDGTRLASGSGDKTIRVWDLTTRTTSAVLKGHFKEVYSVVWSPDGTRLASGSGDETLRLWDVAVGTVVAMLEGHNGRVYTVSWSPDGTRLAAGTGDESVCIWDVASGALLSTLKGHSGQLYSVSWSRDGKRLASGSEDHTVNVWDVATGSLLATLEGHTGQVTSVTWCPDGKGLASGSWDKTVRVWDVATSSVVTTLDGHSKEVLSVSWSRDGTGLASGSGDGTVRTWEVATGSLSSIMEDEGLTGALQLVRWSSTDEPRTPFPSCKLTSASKEKMLSVRDLTTKALLATLERHADGSLSMRWSRDGAGLSPGSWNKAVKIREYVDGTDN